MSGQTVFSPDGLHHASISQLPCAEFTIKAHRFLELVGFDAANKERLTSAEGGHQSIQGTLELKTESWRLLTSLCCLSNKRNDTRSFKK